MVSQVHSDKSQFVEKNRKGICIMRLGFSYRGLIWLIMLFIPNLIWTKNKPENYDEFAGHENKVLLALERVGEVIVTATALSFSDFNYKGWNFWLIVLVLSFLCMVLYEIFWIRYFKSGKTMKDFYRSQLGIPVAGATLPVIAFLLLGIYGGNGLMVIGSIILGIGHIGIHLAHHKEAYGPKEKKPIAIRIALGILKTIISIVLILVLGFSTFAIVGRNITQIKHASEYRGGINEESYIDLEGEQQYIHIMGKDTSNPVILFLHGGPGVPSNWVEYCWADYLTDEYTVVFWDQRGCGRTYIKNEDLNSNYKKVVFEQAEVDLDALVDYLCDRFGQEKIVIMGHSYGSLLGNQYVLAHPEKVAGYIGIGQLVKIKDNYSIIYNYEDALKRAEEMGADTTELKAAYEAFINDPSDYNEAMLTIATEPYHQQTVTEDASIMAYITSPYFGIDDARWYIPLILDETFDDPSELLEEYASEYDAYEKDLEYQVPVLFISGTDDWTCPAGIVEKYENDITAPRKGIYLFEGCGHAPHGQLPEEFAEGVKSFLQNK